MLFVADEYSIGDHYRALSVWRTQTGSSLI